jgi:hypothetical protein
MPDRQGRASWPFFFELDDQAPQASRAIDNSLALTLTTLQGLAGEKSDLPLLNLQRGAALGLPAGQAAAAAMKVTPLPDAELAPAPAGSAPLWFYVLREAQVVHEGQHLGPVGGRVVGETLLGLLRADPQSYLSLDPAWTPTLPTRSGDPRQFDISDLLTYAVPQQVLRF